MIEDIVIPIVGCLTAIIIVSVVLITKYKLKVEQIKADAMIRAEEIKARNQLELEKLMHKDFSAGNMNDLSIDERKISEKV